MASLDIGTLRAYSTSSNAGRYSCVFYYDSVTRNGKVLTLNNASVVMTRYSSAYTTNRIAGCFFIGNSNNYVSWNQTLNSSGHASPATITYSLGSPSYESSDSSLAIGVYLASTGASSNWGNFQGNSPLVLSTYLSAPVSYTNTNNWYLSSRTDTSLTYYWSTSDTCSYIRYGTSTSSYNQIYVNASSGYVTFSGLQNNTNYNLYFMPCRSDTGAWGSGSNGNWSSSNATTYPTPVYVNYSNVSNITPFSCSLNMGSSNPNYTNGSEFSIYNSDGSVIIKGPYQYLDSNLIWSTAISGLTPETTYTAKFRVRTSVSNQWSAYVSQSFTTPADQSQAWINDGNSSIKGKVWISTDGSTWTVAKKIYVTTDGSTWTEGTNQ